MKLLTITIPVLLALSMVPASSAAAIGPCDDGGALNLAYCTAETGESATCTILYGGSAQPDCVTRYIDVTLALCDYLFGSPDCVDAEASTLESSAALLGPCDDGGALNLVYCTAETSENAVCVIIYGGTANPTCISDRVDLTVDTILHAVCVIVFGSSQCDKLLAVTLDA